MRSGVLSCDAVLHRIGSCFVPFALNVTTDGFGCVAHLPALRHLQAAYTTNWRFAYGFASCLALTSDGQHPLAWCSAGNARDEDEFLLFLASAQQRNCRVAQLRQQLAAGQWKQAAKDMATLVQEVVAEMAAKMAKVRPSQPQ